MNFGGGSNDVSTLDKFISDRALTFGVSSSMVFDMENKTTTNESENQPWVYSHTQVALFNLCKRRYYRKYVQGIDEPTTINQAFSSHLLHAPIEKYLANEKIVWQDHWQAFLQALGLTDDPRHAIFNLKIAGRLLDAFIEARPEGEVVAIEPRIVYTLAHPHKSYLYVSKPDFILRRDGELITYDLKMSTSFFQNDLAPFDDQCMGQAVASEAQSFCRFTLPIDKRSGSVRDPIIEEMLVDLALRDQWLDDTYWTLNEMERYRTKETTVWPKNDRSCHAFGIICPGLQDCQVQ